MIFKVALQPGQRFYIACVLLLLFGAALHFEDMRRVGFVVHDDRVADLAAGDVRAGGISEYLKESSIYVKGQSRASFYFTYSLFIAPYFLEEPARSIMITIVHVIMYILIAVFIFYYCGKPTALLVLVGMLCFLPYPGGHYPGAAWPLLVSVPIGLFFLGYNLHLIAKEATLRAGTRRLIHGITFLCVLGAVAGYESLYIGFAIIEGVIIYSLARPGVRGGARSLKSTLRAEAPIIAAFVVYGVVYIGFRAMYPSAYAGTSLGDGSIHLGSALKAIVVYAVSGLPGANWLFGRGGVLARDAVAQGGGLANFAMRQVGWEEVILGVGSAVVVWLYLIHSEIINVKPDSDRDGRLPVFGVVAPQRPSAGRVALTALLVAFAMQVPLVFSARYRENPEGWAPYVPSFFAFLCFCVAVPAVLKAMSSRPLWRRRLVASLCAGAAGSLCLATREASTLVLAEEQKSYEASRLVDLFMKSKIFSGIPEGALIVAPNLWDDISPAWDHYSDYWAAYVRAHTGRRVRVLRTLPDLAQVPHIPGQVYYLEKQGGGTTGQGALLLSDLHIKDGAGDAALRAASVTVLSSGPLNGAGVVFQQPSDVAVDSLEEFPIGFLQATPLSSHYDRGAFVARVDIPDTFIPGTAYLVSDYASISKNKLGAFHRELYEPMRDTGAGGLLRMEFGRGFAGLESNAEHRWRWSDGPSGVGEIIFWNRTPRPIEAVFELSIGTGYTEPSKLILEFRGKPETVPLNESRRPLIRRWTFAPGKNQLLIHSFARRLRSDNDPRYIVFGVSDWKLTLSK